LHGSVNRSRIHLCCAAQFPQVRDKGHREGRANLDALSALGMRKSDAGGMKKIPAQRGKRFTADDLMARGAIDCVTHNGAAQRGEMNANLVRASRVNIRLDQRECAEPQAHAPIGTRLAAFATASRHARAAVKVACDGQVNGSRVSFYFSVQQSKIGFLDVPLTKFLDELSVSGIREGNDQRAGCFLIQTMDDAGTQRATHIGQSLHSAETMQKRSHQSS
jgi:hypothetical protein